jgi:hypothetical protein
MEKDTAINIDLILKECSERGWIAPTKDRPKNVHNAVRISEAKKWIEKRGTHSYGLTKIGHEILECGGVLEYLSKKVKREKIDEEIKVLTVKELKGNIFHLRYWWLVLLISAILGFISGNFELILKWLQ